MTILQINFILCAVFALMIYPLPIRRKTKFYLFATISFVLLVFVHGLVDITLLPDLTSYGENHKTFAKSSLSQVLFSPLSGDTDYEIGYKIYQKLITYITPNFQFFLVVNSIFLVLLYYKWSRKYSPYFWFSVLLFLCTTFNQSLFVLRQNLSIAVLFLGYPYIIRKDLLRFTLVCLVAYSLHASSAIFFPVYFIYNVKNTKKYLIFLGISMVVLSVGAIVFISKYWYLFSRNDYLSQAREVGPINFKSVIMATVLLFYIIFLKKHTLDEGINKLIFTISVIGIVGNIVISGIGVGRIFLSYYDVVIIQIPIIMAYIKSNITRALYCISVLAIYFAWAYYFAGDIGYWEVIRLVI